MKSGEQTEGVDVDPDLIDHSGELLALERLVKLPFVANHRADMTQRLGPLTDELEQVRARFDELCLRRNTEAARYPPLTAVEACHQESGEPAGPQIVMDLQRLGGLPRPHGPEREAQFRHPRRPYRGYETVARSTLTRSG